MGRKGKKEGGRKTKASWADWIESSRNQSACLYLPKLGSQTCTAIAGFGFYVGTRTSNMGPGVYALAH